MEVEDGVGGGGGGGSSGGEARGGGVHWGEKLNEGLRRRGLGIFLFRAVLVVLAIWGTLSLLSLIPTLTLVEGSQFTKEEIDALKEWIKKNNPPPDSSNFTYDQMKQWFEAQTPDGLRWEEHPRLYPFCVTTSVINDSARVKPSDHLFRFKEIFTDIERIKEKFYNFNMSIHSTVGNKKWIKKITMNRINTPEMDMINLRQWLHIIVETVEPMQALYIQSIVGPMGLPFGEFNLDFPCKDGPWEAKEGIRVVGQLSYCSHRPRCTIQHPSAYIGFNQTGTSSFHAHFFWTDISCMETPYLQFLFLVVKQFNFNATQEGKPRLGVNYMPQLSPIYINTDFDSKSGAPFPYYAEWKPNMYCFQTAETIDATYKLAFGDDYKSLKPDADANYSGIYWTTMPRTYRIQANEVYDACITKISWYNDQRDDDRLLCPPGPFRCNQSYGDMSRENVTDQRNKLVDIEANLTDCYPCGAPLCEDIGFEPHKCDYLPDLLVREVNTSQALDAVESIVQSKQHGVQAILAFLVLVPLANFMARFYKEVCGGFFCNTGPWLFIHVGANILSLFLMWISLGPIFPKLLEFKQQFKQCKALFPDDKKGRNHCLYKTGFWNPHVIMAMLAFLIQHLLVILGFWRMGNAKLRKIQIILHSHFGYGCWLLGSVSVVVLGGLQMSESEGECKSLLFISVFFFATPLFFTAAGVGIDCMTDKKIGIVPPRRQWPVLEQVKLEGRSPFTLAKWIVFGVYTGIMLVFWFVALGDTLSMMSNSNAVIEGTQKKGGLADIFGGSDCINARQLRESEKKGYAVKMQTTVAPTT